MVSELTKNDMSYIVDMMEGVKQKVCRECRLDIGPGEEGTWRTCTKWEDAHTCKICFRISKHRDSIGMPAGVKAVLDASCKRCPQGEFRYPVRESGLCYSCEKDTACPRHKMPAVTHGAKPEAEHQVFKSKLDTFYYGKANCAQCQDNRLPYRRHDYKEVSESGPWHLGWCFRCGGIDRNWYDSGRRWYEEYDPKEFRFPWRTRMKDCECNG